jgi:mRNA-degrading endonuclease toxin of MazEF toxin-antitoxin module
MCKQGDIAWVLKTDRHGRNPKTRPFVIVSDTDGLPDDAPLVGVAVSSWVPHPLPVNQVELPWHNSRHPVTGLNKPSVAICDWFETFTRDEIQNICGRAPAKKMFEIMSHVAAHDDEDE